MDGPQLRQLRIGVGLHHLFMPALGTKTLLGVRLDHRACLVARVLGVRYVAQALISGTSPTGAVLALGAGVDVAHAASMAALGLFEKHRRREALASAFIAGGLAWIGFKVAREIPSDSGQELSETRGLAGWRDQVADQVARHLVPGYAWDTPSRIQREDVTDRSATVGPLADG